MINFETLFEEYIEGGICEESNRRYTCAVELYYKGFLKIIDYLLQRETGIVPSKHKERNEAIEKLNSDIKNLRDRLHIIYRQTYKSRRDKSDCKEIKNAIKQAIFLKGIKGRIKEISKKV